MNDFVDLVTKSFSVHIFICIINTNFKCYFDLFINNFKLTYKYSNSIKLNGNELQYIIYKRVVYKLKVNHIA